MQLVPFSIPGGFVPGNVHNRNQQHEQTKQTEQSIVRLRLVSAVLNASAADGWLDGSVVKRRSRRRRCERMGGCCSSCGSTCCCASCCGAGGFGGSYGGRGCCSC